MKSPAMKATMLVSIYFFYAISANIRDPIPRKMMMMMMMRMMIIKMMMMMMTMMMMMMMMMKFQ